MRIRFFLFAAFALVAVIPIAFYGIWPGSEALDKEVEEVSDRHLLLARNLSHALQRYDRDVRTTFIMLARNAINGRLILGADRSAENFHFRHICIARPDDPRILYKALAETLPCPESIPAPRFEQFKKLAPSEGVAYSPVILAPDGQPALFLVANIDGYLAVGSIRATYFTELGNAIAFGEKGHAAIVDHTGRILAHPLADWREEIKNISHLPPVRRMLAGETGISKFYSPAIKADMIAGFTVVPETGWGVMIPQPMGELEAKARAVKLFALGVILIGLLAAAAAGWIISGIINRPVRAVASAANDMAMGSRDTRVTELPLPKLTELSELASTFNAMADAVEHAIANENDARLRAEAANVALSESHERFRAVVENSTSAIVLLGPSNRFRLVNRRFLDWFGLADADISGQKPDAFLPADGAAALVRLADAAREQNAAIDEEKDITFADGTVHCLVITMFPVLDDDEAGIGVGAILTDVSEQRQFEQRLQQTQRLEAIGQLTGGIAHDFNNILAIIIGHAGFLQSREQSDEKAIDAIIRASKRGADLTQRLLTYARKQTLHPDVIAVRQALQNTQELLSRTLGPNITIEMNIADSLWSVMVDPGLLDASLLNLAINARDGMPDGGRLIMAAENVDIDESAASGLDIRPGRYVSITVRDTGMGISEHDLAHVFEPFFTTKDVGQGSGLGLSMVYGFVRQSGGQIEIESRERKGTAVTLFLPAVDPLVEDEAIDQDMAAAVMGSGEVLIVDDNLEVLETTERMVEMMGFKATTVLDAGEAMSRLDSEAPLDYLISDVALSGSLSGFDIAVHAQRRRPQLGIVLMSGYSRETLDDRKLNNASFQMLAKPFDSKSLAQALVRCQRVTTA